MVILNLTNEGAATGRLPGKSPKGRKLLAPRSESSSRGVTFIAAVFAPRKEAINTAASPTREGMGRASPAARRCKQTKSGGRRGAYSLPWDSLTGARVPCLY